MIWDEGSLRRRHWMGLIRGVQKAVIFVSKMWLMVFTSLSNTDSGLKGLLRRIFANWRNCNLNRRRTIVLSWLLGVAICRLFPWLVKFWDTLRAGYIAHGAYMQLIDRSYFNTRFTPELKKILEHFARNVFAQWIFVKLCQGRLKVLPRGAIIFVTNKWTGR